MPQRSFVLAAALAGATLGLSLSPSHVALADKVILNDGRTVEGTLKRENTGWSVTDADGNLVTLSLHRIGARSRTFTPRQKRLAKVLAEELRWSDEDDTYAAATKRLLKMRSDG